MKPPKPTHLTRREALGALGALGAAGTAACRPGWTAPGADDTSRALDKPYVPGAEAYGTGEERWFLSSCEQCPAGCGVRIRVVEGRAIRIEGNRDNPVNRGGIGPRGLSALQALYDADRLTGPMKRVGGKLVPIGWDDALYELTGQLAALREAGRPDRLLVWSGLERGPMHDLLSRFCRAYGTPNFVDGRPGRTGVLAQAMDLAIGSHELPVYGWEHASYVLSLEAGLLEDSCQSVYFTRIAAALRRDRTRRVHMVHAGPVLDLCAYNADEWVRLRPGTSGALALGLVREILAQHPTAAALPEALTEGADGLRALADTYPPERVEAMTGIAADVVRRLAGELWDQRPSLVVVDERSLAFSNGLDTAMAALALNAVLGAFWDAAGGVRAAPEPPLAEWPPIVLDAIAEAGLARPRLDGADRFGRARSVHETLPDAIEAPGRTPEIALLFHANPAYARQQPARWRRALARIPQLVSFSPFRDETVDELATLVLPDHTYLERLELALPAPAIDRGIVGARVPAIVPLHDTRGTGDVVIDLVHRLGGTIGMALPWRSWRDALEDRLAGLVDAHRGAPQAPTAHALFDELAKVGFWVDDEPPASAPVRVSLRGTWAEPAWHGDPARYPLGLLVYRPLGYAEGGGANQPWLRTLRPRPGAQPWSCDARLHPASAPGISDGDRVRLDSEWGSIELPAVLDERMEPGYVAVPMGGGHTAFGRWARGFGANVLDLVRPGPAPESGADLLCATRVRITRAGGGES